MSRRSLTGWVAPQGDFRFSVLTNLDGVEAWRRIVDVSRHGEVVPLTRGTGPDPAVLRTGDRVVARTGLGRFGFDDVMIVRDLVAGERVVFEKVGRILRGIVEVDVVVPAPSETGTSGRAEVRWHQEATLPWVKLPAPLANGCGRTLAGVLRIGYRRVVTKLLT